MSQEEEYAYGHVLEALTGGLYPNKLDALREYVQNSYDAIKEYTTSTKKPQPCKIEVVVKAGSVIIHDNATGMDRATIAEYRKIGFSKKSYGEYAGWRGIGKGAGLAVAEKLIVTTSPTGIPEAYQLEFRAAEMLKVVRELRAKNQNIPLNKLIEKYSSIETYDEKKKEHYTTVELCKVNSDCAELLDARRIKAHLSQIAPVPFNPQFEYGKRITENLREHLDDYFPVKLLVNGEQVFKPYHDKWQRDGKAITVTQPDFLPVYDDSSELIAYAWYCMNSGKGQINVECDVAGAPVNVSGVVYRVRDIRIGDAQLTRKTLWKTTPERAFYAMGEIHVLEPSVEPTADRNDFKDNLARFNLYRFSNNVVAEINRKAGRQSAELKAEEKIKESFQSVKGIRKELREKAIPKEIVPQMMYAAQQAKEEAKKRKPFAKTKALKLKADEIIANADKVISSLTDVISPAAGTLPPGIYDITKELKFTAETKRAYEAIVKVLRDYFINEPEIYQELIRLIQEELRRAFMSQE